MVGFGCGGGVVVVPMEEILVVVLANEGRKDYDDTGKCTCRYKQYIRMSFIANTTFSESQSFLTSRRSGSGRAFLPSK
jgi:hypothetical protein